MRTNWIPIYALAFLFFAAPRAARAENWPRFRGPTGQGLSAESGLPLVWSATENVAWRTAIPGESWSSPIVWGDRVFVTTATSDGESCRVLALERETGAIVWNTEAFRQATGRKEDRNTFATPTPATDGERVYACFADGSFAALDFAGAVLWTSREHPFYGQHGLASSPLVHRGLLIMARDGSSGGADKALGWQKPWEEAYVLVLDTRTGKERWRGKRGLSRISHGAPAVWTATDGREEVVSEAGDVVQGFDAASGERVWTSEVIGEGKVPSVVIGDGLVFTAGGWGGRESIKAFRLGGKGDLKECTSSSARTCPTAPRPTRSVRWSSTSARCSGRWTRASSTSGRRCATRPTSRRRRPSSCARRAPKSPRGISLGTRRPSSPPCAAASSPSCARS
jgi:outer membrane protein assembly factor BamB